MTKQCCYCVPLKAGVVLVSLIWLIYGLYVVTNNVIYLNALDKFDDSEMTHKNANQFHMYFISMIVLYGIMAVGSVFGLFTVALANTSNMLLIYSKLAYGFIAIEIISSIIGFVVIILFSSPILLTYLVIAAVFSITISVHFAMVVSAYAHRRERKEAAANNNDKQIDVNL